MKDAIRLIVGKTISGVVVKKSDHPPRAQIFLIFTDDMSYALYCSSGDIAWAGGFDRGGVEAVRHYGSDTHKIVLEALGPWVDD